GTAQIAATRTDECGGDTRQSAFALNRIEDLGNPHDKSIATLRNGLVPCVASQRGISRWVRHASGLEARVPKLANVPLATRRPIRHGVVTAVGHGKINSQRVPQPNDLDLGELNQGSMQTKTSLLLDPGFRGQVRQVFESSNELRAAIGIATVIQNIDSH